MKSLMLMSAVMLAAPATAQLTPSQPARGPATTNATQPPRPAGDQAAMPVPVTDAPSFQAAPSGSADNVQGTTGNSGSNASAASSNAAQSGTDTQPQATNSADNVAAAVSKDWAKYDADKNGTLSKTEFTGWMMALRDQNPAQKTQSPDAGSWASAAFTQADKDKSGTVTKAELESFLKG